MIKGILHRKCAKIISARIPLLHEYPILSTSHGATLTHFRLFHKKNLKRAVLMPQENMKEILKSQDDVPVLYEGVSDPHIVYSSYVQKHIIHLVDGHKKKLFHKVREREKKKIYKDSTPLIIEKFLSLPKKVNDPVLKLSNEKLDDETKTYYPYLHTEDIEIKEENLPQKKDTNENQSEMFTNNYKEEIALRMHAFDQGLLQSPQTAEHEREEVEQDLYTLNETEEYYGELKDYRLYGRQGKADPSVPVSKVPCGGCGAPLHCQDPGLPGFVPKELIEGLNAGELRGVLCQRCYFLRHHNTALNVRVSPQLYPKLLEPIKDAKALAVVVIDLLDVPCSIWPNILDILGTKRPVMVIGNKVDLLPADGKNHLQRVQSSFESAVRSTSLGKANICYFGLVSAYTGYGIEDLITKIHSQWGSKGDIYIMGCTNSGKSTLFNALLGSDLCKTQASDLILRATISPWPGTTLNMLKFPVLRPSGHRLHLRVKRIIEENKNKKLNNQEKYTRDPVVATLFGHIGKTYSVRETVDEASDPFSTNMNASPKAHQKIVGINPSSPTYALSKWCYDTPGTVQPDQIINLLTHEELMKVLPQQIIFPQTFCLQTGNTLFIGGLVRLDLLYSPSSVRFTVFRSQNLPTTVVKTVHADAFYRTYLGSELLGVPSGNEERLKKWPALKPKDFRIYSTGKYRSCTDVVLSSAGWVALTGVEKESEVMEVRGWTPSGRGMYLRTPSLLPLAVTLRGPRKSHSVEHQPHKIFVPQ